MRCQPDSAAVSCVAALLSRPPLLSDRHQPLSGTVAFVGGSASDETSRASKDAAKRVLHVCGRFCADLNAPV